MAEYSASFKKKNNIFVRILALLVTIGFIWWGYQNIVRALPVLSALRAAGITPAARILSEIFKCMYPFTLAGAGIFLAFSDNSKAAGFARIARVIYAASAIFSYLDLQLIRDFKSVRYPSYLDDEPKKTLVKNIDCDYDRVDQINVECYEVFRGSNFKGKANIEIVYKEDMTDSFGVEVIYRGTPCRLVADYYNYSDYEYENEENESEFADEINSAVIYKAYISLYYENSSDYDLQPKDIVMMYKYREDLRYTYSYVIDKINIYTAHPEKFDTSRVYGY